MKIKATMGLGGAYTMKGEGTPQTWLTLDDDQELDLENAHLSSAVADLEAADSELKRQRDESDSDEEALQYQARAEHHSSRGTEWLNSVLG